PVEEELREAVDFDLGGEGAAGLVEGGRLAAGEGPRPVRPRPPAVVRLEGGEEGVVVEPLGVAGAEARERLAQRGRGAGLEPREGAAEQLLAEGDDAREVDAAGGEGG